MNIKKQEKKIVLVFIISILLYAGFVLKADIKKITTVSTSFNWLILPLLLLLTFMNYLFRAIRFQVYLKKINIKLPFITSLKIFLSGLSMTVTPGKAGEIIKAYLVKKYTGNKFAETVPLLIIERVTDGIAMILLGLGGIYFFKQSTLFFIMAILFTLAFILFIRMKKLMVKLIIIFEQKVKHIKILDFAVKFFNNSQKLLDIKNLTEGTIIGIISWFFEGLSLFIIIQSFTNHPIQFTLPIALFIFSFSSIAGFFVFIPGGIGVAEGTIAYFLTLFFKLNLPQAVFITILFRFVTLWFGVLLGLFTLLFTLKGSNEQFSSN